jgi:cytochrome P450
MRMAYEASEQELPPVTDWVHDWDWLDPQWGPNAIDIWNDVRAVCPVATTERYGRAFMPVTYEGVAQVAHDTEHFSSIWVNVSRPDAKRQPAPPITSDPPDHHGHRRLLLPSFSPKVIAPMEADMVEFCQGLIAELDGRTTADASDDYAEHIPVHGICQLLGVPESDADMFRDWIFRNFQLAPRDNAVREQVGIEMNAYLAELLKQRREEPADDLLTLVSTSEIDGQPIPIELQLGYAKLMIIAGIDTTWSAIGSGIWHFAQHADDRARLAAAGDDDPLWDTAIEEVLRFYAPVTMARKVIADTEVAGCPVHAGDQMLVTFPAANHDPAQFEAPHEFQIDRAHNRHVAFGLGVHRCLGSNLARLEMLVGIREWIRAFPDYELDPQRETKWANGQVRGPRSLPVLLHL